MLMKTPIRIKIAILTLLLSVAVQAYPGVSRPSPPTEQPWKSGETTVTLSDDGTFRVSGNGKMEDYYPRGSDAKWYPWFYVISQITSLAIEEGVTHIGNFAFYGLGGLTSVTIPNGVISIGNAAFFGSGLTSITTPNSVAVIGHEAFFRCNSLISITIPNSVTSVGNYAFSECESLTSITIPNSVTSIGVDAFRDCSNLTSVTIEDGVRYISNGMFASCTSLTSVVIPGSMETIGDGAFFYCTSLRSVTIPESVVSIGRSAFSDCRTLTSVISLNPVPPTIERYVFSGLPSNACLYVPAGSIDAYRTADQWGMFACIEDIASQKTGEGQKNIHWIVMGIIAALVLSAAVFIIIKRRPAKSSSPHGAAP